LSAFVGVDPEHVQAAIGLARAADLSFDLESGWLREPEAVRERAAKVIAATPQPPGLSRASELHWGEGEQMSSLAEDDIQLMVQANTVCDWISLHRETAARGR
jgi:hypothetical protein